MICIGGPVDGRQIAIPKGVWFYQVPVWGDVSAVFDPHEAAMEVTVVTYTKRTLDLPGLPTIELLVPEGTTTLEALAPLVG